MSAENHTVAVNDAKSMSVISFARDKHPLVEAILPVEAELFPIRSLQRTVYGDQLENVMSIKYSLIGDVKNALQTLRREVIVNGSRVLISEYDQASNKETFYDCDYDTILITQYDKNGLPLFFLPSDGFGDAMQFSYDRFNHLEYWKWGGLKQKFSYNQIGLVSEISPSSDSPMLFSYNEFGLLAKISLSSRRDFLYSYDDCGGLRSVQLPRGTKHSFRYFEN